MCNPIFLDLSANLSTELWITLWKSLWKTPCQVQTVETPFENRK